MKKKRGVKVAKNDWKKMTAGMDTIILICNDGTEIETLKMFLRVSSVFSDIFDGDKSCSRIPVRFSSSCVKHFLDYMTGEWGPRTLAQCEEAIFMADKYEFENYFLALVKHIIRSSRKQSFAIIANECCSLNVAKVIRNRLESIEDEKLLARWKTSCVRKEVVKAIEQEYRKIKKASRDGILQERNQNMQFLSKAMEIEKLEKKMKTAFRERDVKMRDLKAEKEKLVSELMKKIESIESEYEEKCKPFINDWDENLVSMEREIYELRAEEKEQCDALQIQAEIEIEQKANALNERMKKELLTV